MWLKAVNGLLEASIFIFFVYSVAVILFYFAIFIISAIQLKKRQGLNMKETYEDVLSSVDTKPITVIVPAYNEEVGVVNSVKSLLSLHYPEFEIVVVNDGSKDRTLDVMKVQFVMTEIQTVVRKRLSTKQIKAVYQSQIYENLFLLDKENGGKSDALNAGINLSRYPYFCSIDGDSILERDSLLKVMKPIIESDDEVIAAGGSVRIANGCRIERGEVMSIVLSKIPIVIMQVIEYLRAFLIGRVGLSQFNLLLIVSGAFGVFHKEWVVRAGGFRTDTVGEDMELVVRLHRFIREQGESKRIQYIHDPVCWTESPESLHILRKQRSRWHRGLFESLWLHRRMMLNPRYGWIGFISFPYFVFIELLGPIIECMGYVILVVGFLWEFINLEITLLLFMSTFLLGSLLSMCAVLLEEWSLNKYPTIQDVLYLFLFALTDSFWYRPLNMIWRLEGFWHLLRKKKSWGEMTRKGIST